MKCTFKSFLIGFTCLALLCGCNSAGVDNNNSEELKEPSEENTLQQTEKNVFYPSHTTEKEKFYLQNTSTTSWSPFEIAFDDNYSQLTCKLYEFKDNTWNNLEQMDTELSGDTFWFLVSQMLTNASVSYQNVNREPSSMAMSGGIPFQAVEPDFGTHGVTTHMDETEEVSVEEGKEFPVIANIMWKDADKSLTANTDDFYHPENIDLEDNEAYYMLTFTFLK